ncbi:MAG: glycosyltransferase family 39 protein [Acidobacteriota bacterium]
MKAATGWAIASAVMGVHAVLALSAISRLGVITDEPAHIASGFALLTRGEMKLNHEHPPLVKLLAALPILGLHAPIDPADPDYAAGREWAYARRFVFDGGHDPDRLVMRSRACVEIFAVLLGLQIYGFAAGVFGHRAAILPVVFYAFDPAFLGHGPVVQFDVALALFVFASSTSFHGALLVARPSRFAYAGIALGLGLASKFTAVYILPIWVVLILLERKRFDRRRIAGVAFAATLAATAIALCYGVVLLPELARGFGWQLSHASRGHVSYFWGAVSNRGTPFYFPVAMLLKTPVETLAAFGLAAIVIGRCGVDRRVIGALCAGATFFALLLPSSIDIGHRYMLPVYPFLYAALGSLGSLAASWSLPPGSSFRFRSVPAGLAAILVLRALAVFPGYIGFTNALAGSRPERVLADSNLDWGQDLPALATYLRARGNPEIGLAYEGMDSPERRGIRSHRLGCARETGLCIASINCVVGISPAWNRSCYAWLKEETPVARVGTSLLVYEVAR